MLHIKQALKQDKQIWDDYVKAHPNATPYHLFAWGESVQAAYKHKPLYLLAFKDNTLVGVLPLIQFKKPFAKLALCSLPFCDLGGVLADTREVENRLLDYACDWSQQKGNEVVDLRQSGMTCLDEKANQSAGEADFAGKKVRMLLNLPDNSEQLWDGFKSKLRSQIRKADKNGLAANAGSQMQRVDDFYQVFARNMRDLGSPVHSKQWFESVFQHYGDNAIIANVYLDDLVIGSGVVLICGDRACIPWASTNSDYNRLAPNMLLYWTLLKHCCDAGIKTFDFGRSTFNEGTYKFKSQWGAKPELLNWHQMNARQKVNECFNQNSNHSKLRTHVENIWRKLPVDVTTFVGPKIRKYISL